MVALPADLSIYKSNPNAPLLYNASRATNALGFDPSVDPAVIDYQPTNPGGHFCLIGGPRAHDRRLVLPKGPTQTSHFCAHQSKTVRSCSRSIASF